MLRGWGWKYVASEERGREQGDWRGMETGINQVVKKGLVLVQFYVINMQLLKIVNEKMGGKGGGGERKKEIR